MRTQHMSLLWVEVYNRALLRLRSLSLSALWSGTALDTTSFWSVQVVGWDPVFSVCLCACCNSRSISVWLLASHIDLLNRSLGGLALLLLWEVWSDPNVVEEVSDTDCAAEEEEVKENASSG